MNDYENFMTIFTPYGTSDLSIYLAEKIGLNLENRSLQDVLRERLGNDIKNKEFWSTTLSKWVNFILVDEELYVYKYDLGIYIQANEQLMVHTLILKTLNYFGDNVWSSAFEAELIKMLERNAPKYRYQDINKTHFSFRKQALNLSTLELENFNPSQLTTICSNCNPNKGETKIFDKFLKTTFSDEGTIEFIKYWLGYQILIDRPSDLMVWFYSSGASGKSTLMSIIRNLVGATNVTNTGLKDLGETFGMQPLLGKTSWLLEEGGGESFDAARLKSVISGSPIGVNRKNKKTVEISFNLKSTISFNKLPIPEDTIGFARRIVLVDFPNTFISQADLNLSNKLVSEKDAIAYVALNKLKELKNNNNLDLRTVISDSMRESTTRYLNKAKSPVHSFIEQCCRVAPKSRISKKKILQAYNNYLDQCGLDSNGTELPRKFWGVFRLEYMNIFSKRPVVTKSNIEYIENLDLVKFYEK